MYLIFFQNSSTLDIPVTPGESFYVQPSSESSSGVSFNDIDTENALSKPVEALNTYLVSRDLSPIRSQLTIPWETAGKRTKRYYIRKVGQGVTAVVQDIALNEHDASSLFQEACSSSALRETLSTDKDSDDETIVDETLMSALAECYYAATCWEPRRQILSVMADKVPFKRLLKWIPYLTKYRYTEAKLHCFLHGRGAPVKSDPSPRKRVSTAKIDHFITFITGSHIVQDLPFGERCDLRKVTGQRSLRIKEQN